MELSGTSKLLRIFVGEIDKVGHQPLYEAILFAAKKDGLAGCTVLKGIMSFGASTRLHTAKLLDLSEDLPIVIEIVDAEEKIDRFIKTVEKMLAESKRGGLITIEKVDVIYYKGKSNN